jgi:hypothetical protein
VSLFVEPALLDAMDPTFTVALEEHGVSVVVVESALEIQLPSADVVLEVRP